jgi:hypothetical protein
LEVFLKVGDHPEKLGEKIKLFLGTKDGGKHHQHPTY